MEQTAKSHESKKFNRLSISAHKLASCVSILKKLSALRQVDEIYEAALSFAVVLYAIPFSDNERKAEAHATPRVKGKEILRGLSKDEKILHGKLIALRNQALAHAEWDTHPTSLDNTGVISSKSFSIMANFQENSVCDFEVLAQKVLSSVELQRAVMICTAQLEK